MGSYAGLMWKSSTWEPLILDGVFSSFALSIDVPDGFIYQVIGCYITFTTNGTAGDRRLVLAGDNVNAGSSFIRCPSGVLQAASLTRHYSFGIGLPDVADPKGTLITVPISPIVIPDDHRVRVFDINAIAAVANGDTLSGRFNVLRRRAS